MQNPDDVRERVERIISEIKDLLNLFETEIADQQKAVSFKQVKEIEASMERLRNQGLPVPEELKQLKLKLFAISEAHKEFMSLYKIFLSSMRNLSSSETHQNSPETTKLRKTGGSSNREPPKYERSLGSKGNSNLEDYLIPIIKLMWSGKSHQEAFREIAKKLDVRYNTVSSQCTISLGLTTDEFIDRVTSKTIVGLARKQISQSISKN